MCARGAPVSGRVALSQVAGVKRMNRARGGGVLQVAERRHVLLVRLQRRKDRTQLEIGAGAADGVHLSMAGPCDVLPMIAPWGM